MRIIDKKVIYFPVVEFRLGCGVLGKMRKINELHGIFFFFQALARSLKKQCLNCITRYVSGKCFH